MGKKHNGENLKYGLYVVKGKYTKELTYSQLEKMYVLSIKDETLIGLLNEWSKRKDMFEKEHSIYLTDEKLKVVLLK